MQYIKRYILLLIICIFQTGEIFANTDKKVLIISSYGTDYQWANSIIDSINTRLLFEQEIRSHHPDLPPEYIDARKRFTFLVPY